MNCAILKPTDHVPFPTEPSKISFLLDSDSPISKKPNSREYMPIIMSEAVFRGDAQRGLWKNEPYIDIMMGQATVVASSSVVVRDLSPIEKAVALYELGQETYALDAFAHPLIDKMLEQDLGAVNSMLDFVRDRIVNHVTTVGAASISRDFQELEMWLAAVTITKKLDKKLPRRGDLVEVLREAIATSEHIDKQALLQVVY